MSNDPGEKWLKLGKQIDAQGRENLIAMPLADLQTHMSIVGATNSGKSTLLRVLDLQIFDLGSSIITIEPHGDLVDDIISGCDNGRLRQVVVLDINSLCPPAIPLMTVGLRQNMDVAKQMGMSVLRVADPANWDASGQMREVLRHTFTVLLDAYDQMANLVWLKRFFSENEANAVFREKTLALCSREVSDSRDFCYKVKGALEGEKGVSELKQSVRAAARRVDIFLEDRRFRRCLALPQLGPVVSLPELMAGQRMILAPVRKSELGEEKMQILSTLLMWMTIRSLMARKDRADRKQVAITIDEFATMAGCEVGNIVSEGLAEARKYGASLILATQFLAQLPISVQDEVKTNTLNKIVMNLPDDSQAAAAVKLLAHPDLTPPDIQAVERFHFYAKTSVHKALQPPCYLAAFAPIFLKEPEQVEKAEVPPRPRYSTDTIQIHQLVEATQPDPDDPHRSRELLDRLVEIDEDTFQAVVKETIAANEFYAKTLLAEPQRKPDKVERAKLVSGYLYGIQWWLRDGYYWRLKDEGKKKSAKTSTQKPKDPIAELA